MIYLCLRLYHPSRCNTGRWEHIQLGEARQLQRRGLPFLATKLLSRIPSSLVVSPGAARIVTVALTVPPEGDPGFHQASYALLSGLSSPV